MQTLVFFFAILSTPTDRIICDMWTRAITQADMLAACGTLKLEGYRVDVYSLDMQLQCSRPATDLPNIAQACGLNAALDQYVIRLVEPEFSTLLCMVESEQNLTPSTQEIAEQCPGVDNYVVRYAGERLSEAKKFACPIRELTTGFGFYDQPLSHVELVTRDELPWLAGQLIWNGYVKVISCNGTSGVNMKQVATPCGYLSAHDEVVAWQNQFNAEIFDAALAYRVPARLLKRMIMIESQFWPFYTGPDDEIGVMQVTDNGLDTFLRFDRVVDPEYISRDEENKSWSRSVTRERFGACVNCRMEAAIAHIKNAMPYYARLLAAYHCRAVTINPALTGADEWRQTVVDYNGSGDYLKRIEQ